MTIEELKKQAVLDKIFREKEKRAPPLLSGQKMVEHKNRRIPPPGIPVNESYDFYL